MESEIIIIDLDNKEIKVTDLDAAILQAGNFKDYKHQDVSFKELDKRLSEYWSDIYNKLIALKSPHY